VCVMKKIAVLALIIALCLLVLVPGMNASAATFSNDMNVEVGQSAEYEVDLSGMMDFMDDEATDVEIDIKESFMKFTVTGEDNFTIGEESLECWIITQTWGWEIEGSGKVDGITATAEMSMDGSVEMWIVKDGMTVVKEIEETTQWFSIKATGYDQESESVEKYTWTLTTIPGTWPEEYSEGDDWTLTDSYSEESEEKERTKEGGSWGEWDIETDTSEGVSETKYEVMGEETVTVKSGTFECVKIKVTEDPEWEDEYEIHYFDENLIPVKYEIYDEDGELEMSFSQKTKIGSGGGDDDDDDDSFLPGFEAVALITAGVVAVFIVRKVTRK